MIVDVIALHPSLRRFHVLGITETSNELTDAKNKKGVGSQFMVHKQIHAGYQTPLCRDRNITTRL